MPLHKEAFEAGGIKNTLRDTFYSNKDTYTDNERGMIFFREHKILCNKVSLLLMYLLTFHA